jgi:hypothetical protein
MKAIMMVKNSFYRFLLISVLAIALIFGFNNNLQALATPMTSNQTNDQKPYFAGESLNSKQAQTAKENAKDNVVDKLNLKESVPSSTKKFIKQIKGEEPIERDTPLPDK